MRLGILLTVTVVCNAALKEDQTGEEQSLDGCVTDVRLRDKWRFLHHGRRPFIRVRRAAFIFRNGKYRVRLKCVENLGNIYLLRKSKYNAGEDAVVCIGFNYLNNHPLAEFTATRLMSQGIGSHIMSPKLFPHRTQVSINKTCDRLTTSGPQDHRQYAFILRAELGCKFPKKLQRSWNFTYMPARSLDISVNALQLVWLDGKRLQFQCEYRDSNRYIVRSHGFPSPDQDAYMCVHFMPATDDPFYSFVFSRLNSGNYMDNLLRLVAKGRRLRLYDDCDWIDSPARPEFMYP